MSASGHVPCGETPIDSLIREVKEELGLEVQANELKLLGKFWRNEIYRNDFIENELDYIYVLEMPINIADLKIQEEEVENVDWIALDNFKAMLKNNLAVNRMGVWDALFKYLKK